MPDNGPAVAGFVFSLVAWISLALSLLATIAWTLILVFAITDDNWDWGTEPDTVRVTAAVLGAGARFIGA
jgi:hypothetical protein